MKNALKLWFVLIATTLIINAQSLQGIKICIDPGHGGNDPANDRFIPETGFWESQGNLDKAFHLEEILTGLGAEVILTRYGNDNSDEVSLSQRAEIANQNNVDFFLSIHSNATGITEKRNSTLILYHGYNNDPAFPEAKAFSSIIGEEIYEAHRTTHWTIYGDRTFYGGSSLGVLRPLALPGVLSEGSFHDYIPESFRLRNQGYTRHEAWAMAKSFIRYFNAGSYQVGEIAGIVRDKLQYVDYFYLPGSNDGKKPVNNVTITLQPGGKTYIGDIHNNGFFLFDSLEPGEYTLYVEAENYQSDTLTATVQAGETSFADTYLTLQPNLNPPAVTDVLPFDGYNGVSLLADIRVGFDTWMDEESVQNAFSILPDVSGTFEWDNDMKAVTFVPNEPLAKGTNYTITISGEAKSYFGVNIENEYTYDFTTRSKLNLVNAYPAFANTDISRTVEVRLNFDAAIDPATLFNNIRFTDSEDNDVAPIVDQQAYAKGQIVFTPASELEPNSTYFVRLGSGLGDVEDLTLGVDVLLMFTTEDEVNEPDLVVEDFESKEWEIVSEGLNVSYGYNPDSTSFGLSTSKKVEGQKAGRLNYAFNKDTAQVYISSEPDNFSSGDFSNFGLWIYGDLSGNEIFFEFFESDIGVSVLVDTVDWTGWKYKSIEYNNNAAWMGMSVVRTETGNSSGTLYFDKAVNDIALPVDPVEGGIPAAYTLEQNYPNPFNPSTTIRFNLPEAGNVSLVVYNLLGEEVAALVNNEFHNAGTWQTVWNGKNAFGTSVPSGVYFYRLTAGSFTQVRKMVLLK